MRQTSIYIFAILALVVSACSNSHTQEPAAPQSKEITIDVSANDIEIWQETASARASSPLPPDIQSVGVFAINDDGSVFDNQKFYNRNYSYTDLSAAITELIHNWPTGNDWPYTPAQSWKSGALYSFVAYAPHYPAGVTITTNASNDITELTWKGIPSIAAADHLVANGKTYTARASSNDVIGLQMEHLMARLRFCFKIGADYAKLRTIVVKKMKVSYAESRSMTLIVTYAKSGDTYTPSYRWLRGEPGTGNTLAVLNNEPGITSITLSKEDPGYKPLASLYYEPGDPLTMFNIEVVYDIKDREDKLLRENDSAVSAINMPTGCTVERGKYYDVKITIEPSYLYILSDGESDAEGGLIIP